MKFLKAQVFSYDLVFALMAVAFLLWYSVNAANALAGRIDSVEKDNRMAEVAQSAFAQLTESPGDPPNWAGLEANSLGLAESRGVLDRAKVENFALLAENQSNYDDTRAILSMNRQGGAYL
ncbi:MAG: hypothetical protein V1909_05270, partial [Candidatus Micrarchaeota archaeon]